MVVAYLHSVAAMDTLKRVHTMMRPQPGSPTSSVRCEHDLKPAIELTRTHNVRVGEMQVRGDSTMMQRHDHKE